MELVIAHWQIRITRRPTAPIHHTPPLPPAVAARLAQEQRQEQDTLRERQYARLLLRE